MKRLNNKKGVAVRRNKGFTLMEMLIVIAIIAILVTILVPAIGSSLRKAREAADVANIRAAYAQYQLAWADGKKPDINQPSEGNKKIIITEMDSMGNPILPPSFEASLNYVASNGTGYGTYVRPGSGINSHEIIISYQPKELNDGRRYEWKVQIPE